MKKKLYDEQLNIQNLLENYFYRLYVAVIFFAKKIYHLYFTLVISYMFTLLGFKQEKDYTNP